MTSFQVVKAKGGMPAKRLREEIIIDFAVKDGDAPAIIAALNFVFPDFQNFLQSLSDSDLNEFHAYLIKQKNSDRVLEWILGKIQIFRGIQDT